MCVRACMRACVRACVHACMYVFYFKHTTFLLFDTDRYEQLKVGFFSVILLS